MQKEKLKRLLKEILDNLVADIDESGEYQILEVPGNEERLEILDKLEAKGFVKRLSNPPLNPSLRRYVFNPKFPRTRGKLPFIELPKEWKDKHCPYAGKSYD